MKHLIKFSAILLLLLSSCVPPQQEVPEENTVDSYQDFYDGLSPYGHWVQHPAFGYVWMPEVGADFVPYSTDGYWAWTSYGWTWVSDYQWGWAPFHYGRWNFEDEYGWYWVPDLTWGPAWVAWREEPGCYGWAPIRPGISIDLAIGGGYEPPEMWWTVCDNRYFGDRDIRHHYVNDERRGRIISGESRGVSNTPTTGGNKRGSFLTGPAREDVQRITGTPVQEVKIAQSAKPGQTVTNNTLSIYRPSAQRIATSQAKPVPRSVTTTRDVRDLRQQANPNNTGSRGGASPPNIQQVPRQSSPAPRQQAAPRQQSAPRQAPAPQRAPQQAAPRSNGQSQGGGRPK